MLNSLLIAIQFLTIIPVPEIKHYDNQQFVYSVLYYPLVGLLIGGLLLLIAVLVSDSPPLLAAALTLATWVILTGGLHLDGLGDSADAWVGGLGSKKRTLEIMKDPRSGPMAVIAICLLLIIKFAALATLIPTENVAALLIIPVLGRLSILALYQTTKYVRILGMGSETSRYYPKIQSTIILFSGTLLSLLFLFVLNNLWSALLLLAGLCLLLALLRKLVIARLGGITGDTLGAAVEITEMYCLIFWSLV